MTSGVLTVTTCSGETAVVAGKSYLVLSPEEDRSAEILRLERKGLLKRIGGDPSPVAAPTSLVSEPEPKTEPVKTEEVPTSEPETTPEPDPVPEPESTEEVSGDPVDVILGESPEGEGSEETSEDPKNSETPVRRTKRRRKRSQ